MSPTPLPSRFPSHRSRLAPSGPAGAGSRIGTVAASAGPDLSLFWMFLAGILVMALASAAGAATPPATAVQPPGFAGEVTVQEVLLDALVTDRAGNVILGLGPQDFQVTVGGQPAEISDVTFYSNRRYLEGAGASRLGLDPATVPDRRYFILFFDDLRRSSLDLPGAFQVQIRAARDASRWLATETQPGDRIAVVSFDAKLKLFADFTGDRQALLAAVEAATRGAEGRGDWPSRRAPDSGEASLAAALPVGNALRDATPTVYEALQTLASAAAQIPGRKNLLLYSIGFGDINRFGQWVPDARYQRPTAEALNAANVAVYGVDLTRPGLDNPLQNGLNSLALETGGRLFWNLQSFTRPLTDVAKETNGYYLIAIRAGHPAGESGYQPVEVALANPEFRITARRGYRYGEN